MANKTRFQVARNDIAAFFDSLGPAVFKKRDIELIFRAKRDDWKLAGSTKAREFIDLLLEHTALKQVKVAFPDNPKAVYTWGEITVFEVGLELVPRAYLSHYTALYLHGLTDQIPKHIYINHEQSPKDNSSIPPLTQPDVDAAFAKPQPYSSNQARFGDYTFVVLNGKYTNRLGVVEQRHFIAGNVQLTNLERTLIDLVVRADYVGGVYEVVEAYRRAAPTVSINRLVSLLTKLDYRYPYHQAIGFYIERAGNYRPAQIQLLKKMAMNLDFYLTYDMGATDYSAEWRLHYPKGF